MDKVVRLQAIRHINKLSQRQLSIKSGVNINVIKAYEQGLRFVDGAGIEILYALATNLNCRISDLIENKELRENLRSDGY